MRFHCHLFNLPSWKTLCAKTKKAPQECHACTSRDFFLWIFPRKKYPITSSIPGSSRSSFIPKKIFSPPCQPYGGISLDGGCSTRVIKPEAMRPYKTSFWKTIKTLTQHTSLYPKGNFYFKDVMKHSYKL